MKHRNQRWAGSEWSPNDEDDAEGCSSRVRAGSGVVRVVASTSLRGGLSRLCPALPPDHPGADPAGSSQTVGREGWSSSEKEGRWKVPRNSWKCQNYISDNLAHTQIRNSQQWCWSDQGSVGCVIYQRRLCLLKMSKTYVNLNLIISERSAWKTRNGISVQFQGVIAQLGLLLRLALNEFTFYGNLNLVKLYFTDI